MNTSVFDTLELAGKIKKNEINIDDYVQDTLNRIKKNNLQINAISQFFSEDYVQQQIKALDKNAPFAGVPFLLKDLGIYLPGIESNNCSRFFQGYVPDFESEIVKRFRKMGFILLGKTNTPEMGLSFVTEPLLNGPTRNPLDLNKTPGGSSGGAAAAIASGMISIAHASDGGGSIRTPAACCGLIGLKPTRARTPQGPIVGEGWSGMSSHFVLTKSVRDAAFCLDWLSGPEIGDPYHAPPSPKEGWFKNLDKPLKPLKIAYTLDCALGYPVEPVCQTAVEKALVVLEQQGHQLVQAWPEFDAEQMIKALKIIVSANAAWTITARERQLKRKARLEELEQPTWLMVEDGRRYTSEQYAEALFQMHYQSRKIAYFFETYDILITPALAKLPVEIGHFSKLNYQTSEDYHQAMGTFSPFTGLWNQTGQPAITFPCNQTQEGFPVSIQVVGRFGDEDTLLRVAKLFCGI